MKVFIRFIFTFAKKTPMRPVTVNPCAEHLSIGNTKFSIADAHQTVTRTSVFYLSTMNIEATRGVVLSGTIFNDRLLYINNYVRTMS